jgi:DNA-binding LacI/PurR family transcriptional regulator
MTARKVTAKRKSELVKSLRQVSTDGSWAAGEMLPTTRELAEQYGVSLRVVTQELQKLVDEGVLHTIPRVGTFVGRQFPTASDFYLMLLPQKVTSPDIVRQAQIGFEERVAALGAASIVMSIGVALEHRSRRELPTLRGVFDFARFPGDESPWKAMQNVPVVGFAEPGEEPRRKERVQVDTVCFDDLDGGRQAVQHLLRLGHKHIAFLGLHGADKNAGFYFWSEEREAGWREAMEQAGHVTDKMSFHPDHEPVIRSHNFDRADEVRAATQAAHTLVCNPAISAVVAANDYAALGLFQALREAGIPDTRWPSVVGFDDLPQTQKYVLTSLRLPWEEIGKTAVDLLWERNHGRLTGLQQERRVRMRLISRLTSRQNWLQGTSHAALASSIG